MAICARSILPSAVRPKNVGAAPKTIGSAASNTTSHRTREARMARNRTCGFGRISRVILQYNCGRQRAGRGDFYAAPSNCKKQRTLCHSRYSGRPDFRTRHGFTQSGYTTRASNFTASARRASDSAATMPSTVWDRYAGVEFDGRRRLYNLIGYLILFYQA